MAHKIIQFRHSTPILYTGDINNIEEVHIFCSFGFETLAIHNYKKYVTSWFLFGIFSPNLQVFEFLFQNKYTADEDVDLEEVLIKKNSSQFTTPKKNIVSYPPYTLLIAQLNCFTFGYLFGYLFCLLLCKYTNLKDTAGQSATSHPTPPQQGKKSVPSWRWSL